MLGFNPILQPSLEEEDPWVGNFESFNGVKSLRESSVVETFPDTDEGYDDTFKLHQTRLRESDAPNRFNRGVPTNNNNSSQNYDSSHVKFIDGEHKTLLALGKINEAMEDDDDASHIREHRLMLSNPDLKEGQRQALVDHIESHRKNQGKKLKAVAKETGPAKGPFAQNKAPYAPNRPPTNSQIPQDDPQDVVRKRTAGINSQESGFRSKLKRFQLATRRSGRR